jgi:hypothetical protein
MHFIGINFLLSVSRDTKFITAGVLSDKRKITISKSIKQVLNLYKGKGHMVEKMDFTEFNNPVHTILADNEFESLREKIEECGMQINVTAKEEHVLEVERQNRVIKERARATIQTLPYKSIPKKMRIGLIYYVVFWLNNIARSGQDFSPQELAFGERKLDYNIICRIPFDAYVQVHDDLNVTNTMESRMTGAINLGPTGNIQGTHKFLSLKTGNLIVRRK